MKTQLKVLTMYNKIKNLFQDGLSKSAMSRQTGYDRKTIRKYLSMTEDELDVMLEQIKHRAYKLAPYEEFVHQRITKYEHCTSAQVEDWLKEIYPDLPQVTPRTVFAFVKWVRLKYDLPRPKTLPRQCEPVEELPYGEQAQVDFGQQYQYNGEGKRVRVYFMIMVLSRSRQKHIWFTDQPVTTKFVIETHEKAFAYFGGITRIIVYDQDCTILKDENHGSLIYTDDFARYLQQRGFSVFMCHKADPQTKGKVENGVKFVKGNFLNGRPYVNLNLLNEEGQSWLNRTGNAKVHETTFLVPESEWLIEKEYLNPFQPLPLTPDIGKPYGVRPDNVVRFRSNRYTLPTGSYLGPKTQVRLRIEGSNLLVHTMEGRLLATHELSHEKGKLVANNNHRRDTTAKLDVLQAELHTLFSNTEQSGIYLNEIRKRFPRYARDQFAQIKKTITDQPEGLISSTMEYSLDHHLFSCGEFKNVFMHLLKKQNRKESSPLKDFHPQTPVGDLERLISTEAHTSNINHYQQIMS